MDFDVIENIDHSTVQHGRSNNRIYLMKMADEDFPHIINKLRDLAETRKYSKIFAKVKASAEDEFKKNGYKKEADIPRFYNGEESAVFMSKFTDHKRAYLSHKEKSLMHDIIDESLKKGKRDKSTKLSQGFRAEKLKEKDAIKLSGLYEKVFDTYPFPIHDPEYLINTMRQHIRYFGIFEGEKLVSASSAECDKESLNSEMTDFATDPEYLGNGFALFLLSMMEAEMEASGYKTLYTIARSYSYGMNITFAKMNYIYSGTLVNNTNISGKIECMNVWYKNL